ncbi:MAG: hypothetical protein R2815_00305 [Flavobacteriales bacterium]|nr:hypothetical protein [Flavobacteriales bacterium]
MRTTPLFTLLSVLLLAACQSDPKEDPRYQDLETDAARARAMVEERDSTINALFGTFNKINENLREIRTKQGQLTSNGDGAEQGSGMEERIMGDIRSIDELLAENRTLITKLRGQAKVSAQGMAALETTVADLEASMREKDQEIDGLKEELSSTSSSLATLIAMYRDKSQLADMQRNDLNTAYYTVGTVKELRANGVLTKEGGFAGLGGTNKLNMDNLAKDHFTRIDILNTQEIPVLAEKSKLVTAHPAGSYRLEEGSGKLVITDPNVFWSVSKYLVVVAE